MHTHLNRAQGRPVLSGSVFAVLLLAMGGASCGGESGTSPPPTTTKTGSLPLLDANAITGFEDPSGWSVSRGTTSSTSIRTQGNAALALRLREEEAELISAPLPSTAPALAGFGEQGSVVTLDVREDGDGDQSQSAIELTVSSPSRGLQHARLGRVTLNRSRPGFYTTIQFALPSHVQAALRGSTFNDLRFEIKLNAPGGHESGTFDFDNLRVRSTTTPPPGRGQSVDLVALLSYSPSQSTPGVAHFSVGIVQVPQSFHVKLGNAGSGRVQLDLGYGSTPLITCTYGAGPGGTSYVFSSCTGGAHVGDLIGADFARLTILGGDATAGTTKIRAQLAKNPLGDIAGAGLIPPMPTFWGDTPADSSQIITDYFNAVNVTSQEPFVRTPIPEFAQRSGDGSPHDNLLGPPPPHDPPFDQEGHMNEGGNWDAYWRLAGNLTADNSANHNRTHFEAALSAHAVVWGRDVAVASINTTVDTDNGRVDTDGFREPSASGSLHAYVFGIEIPGGGSASPSTGFNFTASQAQNFDLPPIHIWIFAITVGVNASVSVTASGTLSFGGFGVGVIPRASVGAHLLGGVDIGIASGGVSATIDLIAVSTPMSSSANWIVSTDPGICSGSLTFVLDGTLRLTSLGGHVDLEAQAGVCPFCKHWSTTIFSWDPADLGTQSLFHFTTTNEIFPLPPSLCQVPLNVTLLSPTPGANIPSGVPRLLGPGSAVRPATAGTPFQIIECSRLIWTSSDPSDGFPLTGCSPMATFGSVGPRTLTLTATDAFGETGSASVSFNVTPMPTGLNVFIVDPPHDPPDVVNIITNGARMVTLAGFISGGTPPVTLTWTLTPSGGGTPTTLGTGATIVWNIAARTVGEFTVTLTARDALGNTSSASIHVSLTVIT